MAMTPTQRTYYRSDRGRKKVADYRHSINGKATRKKYFDGPKGQVVQKNYRKTDKGKAVSREYQWRRQGIDMSYSRYLLMVDECSNKCFLCTAEQNHARIEKGIALVVDHCHATNLIRGLLCRKHNLALGHFDSDVSRLFLYLKQMENSYGKNNSLYIE